MRGLFFCCQADPPYDTSGLMPYLNWKERNLTQKITSEEPVQLNLELDAASVAELANRLEDTFAEATLGAELRVDLPREWIVFWKLREGESRLLIAHPQPEEWVTTVALELGDSQKVVSALRALKVGQPLHFEQLIRLGSMSNAVLVVSQVAS